MPAGLLHSRHSVLAAGEACRLWDGERRALATTASSAWLRRRLKTRRASCLPGQCPFLTQPRGTTRPLCRTAGLPGRAAGLPGAGAPAAGPAA